VSFLLTTKIIMHHGVVSVLCSCRCGVAFFQNYEKIMISLLHLLSFLLVVYFILFFCVNLVKKKGLIARKLRLF